MVDLRQQAVDAAATVWREKLPVLDYGLVTYPTADRALAAAEPFIRAQVLHDLAESFQGHDKSEDLALFAMETTARIRALVVQEVVEWLRDRGQGPSRLVALIIEREFGGTDA